MDLLLTGDIKQEKFHKFSEQLTTYVSIHQDRIKSVEAELVRHLIAIEHDPL